MTATIYAPRDDIETAAYIRALVGLHESPTRMVEAIAYAIHQRDQAQQERPERPEFPTYVGWDGQEHGEY